MNRPHYLYEMNFFVSGRIREVFSLGLIIPCNWGKTLLSPLLHPLSYEGFPLWLVGIGVTAGPVWMPNTILLNPSGWFFPRLRKLPRMHVLISTLWLLQGTICRSLCSSLLSCTLPYTFQLPGLPVFFTPSPHPGNPPCLTWVSSPYAMA